MRTLLLVLALLASACDGSPELDAAVEDAQQATARLVSELRDYTRERKDEFVDRLEQRLAVLDTDAQTLRARLLAGADTARAALAAEIAVKREAFGSALARARTRSGDAWSEVRDGLIAAYTDLADALAAGWRSLGQPR